MSRDFANRVAFILYLVAWVLFFAGTLLAAILMASCSNHAPGDPFGLHRPTELHAVCMNLQDSDGRFYEMTTWFNDEGYKRVLNWPGVTDGMCMDRRRAPHPVEKPKAEPPAPCESRRCNPNG